MRVVTFSDTHRHHPNVKIPDGDVLLFAGDGEFRSAKDLSDFNGWISRFPHEHKVMIAGNHDFFCEEFPDDVKKYLTEAVYLDEARYVLPNGISIWGSPMTEAFENWAFMATDEELGRNYWRRIPERTDILLTHGPPYKHLDSKPRFGHIGNKALTRRIDELKIPYVIFGHIHEGYGIEKTNETTYVNCAVTNGEYRLANEPVVIDL